MTKRLFATAACAAMLLAGCGKTPGTAPAGPLGAMPAPINAAATRTLLDGFKHIHMAVFTKLDANKDNQIDEYEAGSHIDLKDFANADKNRNGKLTKGEFMAFATDGGLFGFIREDKNSFMKKTRDVLWRAFQAMDRDRDRLLKPAELNEKALKKTGIHLRIAGLHSRVDIVELDDAIFEASDKTGDGALSQAEFEDYCISAFIKGLNPSYQGGNGPAPAPPADPGGDEPPADPQFRY